MQDFLFIFFSCLVLLGALSVVVSRNPVTGVMAMIVSFIGISGLFILLEAFLLAILQIFVYAGAVMVLFLFVVMLLNLEETYQKGPNKWFVILSVCGAMSVGSVFVYFLNFTDLPGFQTAHLPPVVDLPTLEDPIAFCTSAKVYGLSLFTKYLLLVQAAGFLLLMAIIGVVHLAKNSERKGPVC